MNTQHQSDDSLIEGLARVVGVDGDHVWLATLPPAACSSCATKSACGSGTAKSKANWRVPRSMGSGQAPLVLGDAVQVGVDRNALTRATFTAYLLPLVTMLVAACTQQGAGDAMAIAAAFVGLLVGIAVAKVLVRRWHDALVPVVLGRAPAATGSSCATPGTGALRAISIPVIHQGSL